MVSIKELEKRLHCKDCENAKDIQKHRPCLFCSKHRAVINEFTRPTAIMRCMGKDFKERKQV